MVGRVPGPVDPLVAGFVFTASCLLTCLRAISNESSTIRLGRAGDECKGLKKALLP